MQLDWLMISAAILVVIGVLGTFLPVLPGVPIVFLGLLLAAWADHFDKVSVMAMSLIGVMALIAIAIDFFASFITTKKVGASKNAYIGIVIGGLLGIFAGPLGLFFGAAVGALVGELITHKDMRRATTVGLAAGLGFALALIAKVVIVLLMLGVFFYSYYN
jgi:uncharacterized protein